MMRIKIEKLCKEHKKRLFDFERENRSYFETMVPGRGDKYYTEDGFQSTLGELLKEQAEEKSYFHLIFDSDENLVGRINLIDVNKEGTQCELGYRIGKGYIGKKVATNAVKEILIKAARSYGIESVQAKTTTNNIASQKVLENNGFNLLKVEGEKFEFLGEACSFVHYEWRSQTQSKDTF
ncbi:GNAT family N-acetyltransferase [Evansella halocellulosilytica]|uniref:GNAT family N-acetyltransferase n=1 Tax=Evansella halocellulosilytica TaxID=2011013 RepID=UPI00211C2498|nr:GNAT family N-acetyltransferase [Evansella halocellulosilytica]